MQTRNARIGLVLFFVYLALYGGFVLLNAYAPEVMEHTPFAGVNLAILYGFGLIIAALVLALLYGAMCDANDEPGSGPDSSSSAGKASSADSSREDAK